MKKIFKFLVGIGVVGLSLGPSLAIAQTTLPSAGRLDPLDNVGGTARARAMGSAFVGVADDATAVLWNPAGLSGQEISDVSLHHTNWLAQTFQEILVLGVPLQDMGGLGIIGNYVGYGSFDGRDSLGYPTTGYNANQIGGGIGWGLKVMGDLSLGLALHGSQQTFAGSSYSLAGGDLGVLWKLKGGWRIGLSYQGLGFGGPSQGLAGSLRWGVSRLWDNPKDLSILAALSGNWEPNGVTSAQAGVELSYRSILFIRVGGNIPFQDTGYSGLQDLTGGVGLALGSVRLDYAFLPYGDLGAIQLVSLGYEFGKTQAPVTINGGSNPAPSPASSQPGRTITMEFEVPDNPEIARAKTLAQEGKTNEAIAALKAVIDKNPKDASAWRELGNVYVQINRGDYALQCFETVLKLKPEDKAFSDWLEKYKAKKP